MLCSHAAVDAFIHSIVLFFALLCCRISYFLPFFLYFSYLRLFSFFFSFFFFFFFVFSSSSNRDVLEIRFVNKLRLSSLWLYYHRKHFWTHNLQLIIFESGVVRSWLHRVCIRVSYGYFYMEVFTIWDSVLSPVVMLIKRKNYVCHGKWTELTACGLLNARFLLGPEHHSIKMPNSKLCFHVRKKWI